MRIPQDLRNKMAKIQPGSLITAYCAGIHRVVKVEGHKDSSSTFLVTYATVLDSKFNPAKKMVKTCDLSWCNPVDEDYYQKIAASHESQLKALRKALDAVPKSPKEGV